MRRFIAPRSLTTKAATTGVAAALALILLAGGAPGCSLDPYQTGQAGRWERDAGPDGGTDAEVDAEADACVSATEICDGLDNDCDGEIDEGFDLQTDPHHCGECGHVCDLPFALSGCQDATCVVETCQPGHHDVNGQDGDGCEYGCFQTNDGSEVCDGLDNDCNGVVDDGFDLQTNPQHCGQCNRVCVFFQGVGDCVAGQCTLSACRGGYVDKDGNPDNGCECQMSLTPGTVPCVEGQPGACAAGQVCADVTGDGSSHCATAPPDLCDGVDSDCDGAVDEDAQLSQGDCYTQPVGCTETAPGVFDCVGACRAGQPSCVGGTETCVNQVGPAAEVCDGTDNDCNGLVDDGFDLASDPVNCGGCGVQCAAIVDHAVPECVSGQCQVLVCLPGYWDINGDPTDGCEYPCSLTQGGVEQCGDGVDNDCDGDTDEGFDFTTDPANCGVCGNNCETSKPFGTAVSGCTGGACVYACLADHWDLDGDLAQGAAGNGCEYACSVTGGGTETCDGVDNDCDGDTDEGFDKQTDPDHCGGCNQRCADDLGAHAQVVGCANGVCQYACQTDWVDLNGDLALGGAGNGCECQLTSGGTEVCDGVDNDCDGTVDEGAGGAPLSRACYTGSGGCTETSPGAYSCTGPCREGTQTCTSPDWGACLGQVTPQAEVCDNVDNDCDGDTDEDASGDPLQQACYTGPAGTEGVGACHGGAQSCSAGAWGICQGEVTPQTEQCNLADDDCDGSDDEDYDLQTDLANCGQCGWSCVAHAGADSYAVDCVLGICDYACLLNFHDLDGDVDLGDAGTGCEYACVPSNGGVEKCGDNVDNDCDGDTDEGFDFQTDVENCGACGFRCADYNPDHAAPTACVSGTCQYDCNAGWVDLDGDLSQGQAGNGCEYSCTFVSADESCNGQDDDCDGTVDENPTDEGQQCGTTDEGECAYGVTVCNSPNLDCEGNIEPEPELCDGLDNDCDGTVDLSSCLTTDAADVRVDNTNENSIQLDLDAQGAQVHLVWLDTADGDADIHHNCSSDGGLNWTGVWGLYTGGDDAVKPRVLVDPAANGQVYVAYERFGSSGREIRVLGNDGCDTSWSSTTRLDGDNSDSLNIDLAADGTGRVAVVWEDFDEGTSIDDSARNVWLAASDDWGASWSAAVRVNDLEAEGAAYATVPRVAYGASGRIFVTWVDRADGGGDIYVRATDDRGASWVIPSTRLNTDGAGNAVSKFPRLVADAAGHVFVVWLDLRNNTSDVYLNQSGDNGVTWLAADVQLDDEGAPHDSYDADLVFGRADHLHVVWRDFRAGLPTVRVATSDDLGLSWGASVVASQGDGQVSEPRLAADGAGKVFAAWADDRDGLRDVYLNYSLDDGLTFQPTDVRMDTDAPAGGEDSFGVGLAAGAAGAGYCGWIDTRRDQINGDIYFNAAR